MDERHDEGTTERHERMVSGPLGMEFLRFALPSTLGLCAIAASNVADAVFVSRNAGPESLAALNLSAPLLSLFFGLVIMVTVGASMQAGGELGAGRPREASRLFTQNVLALLAMAGLFTAVPFVAPEGLARILGAPEGMVPLLGAYLRLVGLACPLFALAFSLSQYLRLDGFPNRAMAALLLITLFKILFDALFIARLGWGLAGAGWATILSHLLSVLFMLPTFARESARLRPIWPLGAWDRLARGCLNGFSEFVNEISGGIMAFTFNWILVVEAGAQGVAAFTVVNGIALFGILFFYGVSEGLASLLAVNFGAGKEDRLRRLLRLGLTTTFLVGALFSALLLLAPESLTHLYRVEGDGATHRLALHVMACLWPLFPFAGMNIVFSAYFTARRRSGPSALVASCRSLVLPLGLSLAFWTFMGYESIFLALPLAEGLTFLLCLVLDAMPSGASPRPALAGAAIPDGL